jgi:hypothetical protein
MNLLLIPPDIRPPTLAFPVKLVKATGHTVSTPPLASLNNLNQPGNLELLHMWLEAEAATADSLIVSLETLCLGGLIPARRVTDSLDEVLERLNILKQIKQAHPQLQILAFGVIVRVAHDDDPLEEKPYYGVHGKQLRAYSEIKDKVERYHDPVHAMRLDEVVNTLPDVVLQDWLATRARNYEMHVEALELTSTGILDHLHITLDDTSTYGLAALDRRNLERQIDVLGLWHKVNIYPGADEVPAILIARVLASQPTRVYVHLSARLGEAAELLYEDRPVGELLNAHLRAAGCSWVTHPSEADVVLAVNTPARKQGEQQPDYATVDTPERYLPVFVDALREYLNTSTPVVLADVAYANGAETRLMTCCKHLPFSCLAGFSAWNTAGNTLGSAIAMAVLAPLVEDKTLWTEILFNRFVDDYLYQSIVRAQVWEDLGKPSVFDLGDRHSEAEARIDALLKPLALDFWEQYFSEDGLELHWQPAKLAWPRLFTGVFPFEVRKPSTPLHSNTVDMES